ncbi:methyltransferase [Cupriavidus sp. 2TAF22]|uniref:methyltransferase n=1 Tax=unclassified Cupriavidus TaxID=2640874 RepID=UPI003F901329
MQNEADTQRAPADAGAALSPQHLLQLGMGFWAAKAMLSAVELGVFTQLARQPLDAGALGAALGLHPRGAADFLDALVALRVLDREDGGQGGGQEGGGQGGAGRYRNTPEADHFLDKAKSTYVGGLLEMANARLYPAWGALTDSLRTGKPQGDAAEGTDPFATLYRDEAGLRGFLRAMTGVSLAAAQAMAQRFPWQECKTVIDIGAAQGALPVQLALAHPHLRGGGFDLPAVGPVFDAYVAEHGLQDRLRFYPGDFFNDPCPQADVLVMGHILHDWDLEQKLHLLRQCHAALPSGGRLIVYDAMIDDARRQNAFGLLMSLNMLIETPGGFDYTGTQCCDWARQAGFAQARVEPLSGADSMMIATKA